MRTCIADATVITVDAQATVHAPGSVVVEGERIVDVGPAAEVAARCPAVDEVIDANAGFIIGNLEIGAAPNFMILRADPREDFQILLDTKKYASFAMHEGQVVKNTLVRVVEPEPDEQQQPVGGPDAHPLGRGH